MKHLKNIVITIILLSMALTLVGCGGGGNDKKRDKNTLNVLVFNGGYGMEYIERIAEAFEAEYPGITVDIEETRQYSEVQQQVEADRYVADVIITIASYTKLGAVGKVLDISDVYASNAFGETDLTIAEKLGEAADSNIFDGKYYQMPVHAGSTGLVYNKVYLDAVLGEGNYELPVTSNQLKAMFDRIKENGGWATVYTNSTEAEYPIYLRDIWMAQYMGYDDFKNYFNLSYTNNNGEVVKANTADELSAAIRPARESALKALASICSNKLGYAPESASTMSFSQAQAYFVGYTSQPDVKIVDGHKGAAFMVNGDWLYSEVEKYAASVELDIRAMRTPINSAIIDKLSSVNTDEQLAECVKYIDSVLDGKEGTKPAYLNDADYARLLEARRMVWTTHTQQIATIPANCSDATVAKDFLKFIASDASALAYSDSLKGMKSIFNDAIISESRLNSFTESVNKAWNTEPLRVTGMQTPYSLYGSLNFNRYYYFVQELFKVDDVEDDVNKIISWTEQNLRDTWGTIVGAVQ